MHSRLFAEPGQLTLGIAPRRLRYRLPRLLECSFAPQVPAQFAISDEIERFGIVGKLFREAPHFLEPPAREHGVHPCMDALVECFSRWQQTNLHGPPTFEWRPAIAVHLGKRSEERRVGKECRGWLGLWQG